MKTDRAAGDPANGPGSSVQALIRRGVFLTIFLLMAAAAAGFRPAAYPLQAASPSSTAVLAVSLTPGTQVSRAPALTPSPSVSPNPAATPTPRRPAATTDVTGMILWSVVLVLIIIGGTLRAMRPPSRSR